jgi:hypothetical protein
VNPLVGVIIVQQAEVPQGEGAFNEYVLNYP